MQFSIPMPKSGRDAITKNLVLREDQLPQKYLHPKTKKKASKAVSNYRNSNGGKEHFDLIIVWFFFLLFREMSILYQTMCSWTITVIKRHHCSLQWEKLWRFSVRNGTLMITITRVLCTDLFVSTPYQASLLWEQLYCGYICYFMNYTFGSVLFFIFFRIDFQTFTHAFGTVLVSILLFF